MYNGMLRHAMPAVLALGLVAPWAAAQGPGSVEVAAVSEWHTKTTPIDGLRAFGGGLRLGVWLPIGFGVESALDLTVPRNSRAPSARYRLLHLGGSLLYNVRFTTGESLYLRAGYGKLSTSDACRVNGVACPQFGAATFGLGFRLPVSGALQIRAETMWRTRPTYDYSSLGAHLGFSLLTGTAPSADGLADDDRDGVANRRDRCRATLLGALVDDRGCPTDTDGDGVFDGLDRCPTTPRGTQVTPFGCPRDEQPPPAPPDSTTW
jgi:hypothetical protein